MIIDADEYSSNNYTVFIKCTVDNLVIIESMSDFDLEAKVCRNQTEMHDLKAFTASCFVLSPCE